MALGSPLSSVEDNFLLQRLMRALGADQLFGACWKPEGDQDDILIRSDKTPNRQGLDVLGIDTDPAHAIEALQSGHIKCLILLENDVLSQAPTEVVGLIESVPLLIAFSAHRTDTAMAAHLAFPLATHVEAYGCFINFEGHLQRFNKAFDAKGDALAAWELLVRLTEALGEPSGFQDIEDVWVALKSTIPQFSQVPSFYGLGDGGHRLPQPTRDVPASVG